MGSLLETVWKWTPEILRNLFRVSSASRTEAAVEQHHHEKTSSSSNVLKTVKIAQLNINSIRNKIPQVQNFVNDHVIDILELSKTKVDGIKLMNIAGFYMYRKDRSNCGGGVCLLVNDTFKVKTVNTDNVKQKLLETICLQIQVSKFKSLLVCCIY